MAARRPDLDRGRRLRVEPSFESRTGEHCMNGYVYLMYMNPTGELPMLCRVSGYRP